MANEERRTHPDQRADAKSIARPVAPGSIPRTKSVQSMPSPLGLMINPSKVTDDMAKLAAKFEALRGYL